MSPENRGQTPFFLKEFAVFAAGGYAGKKLDFQIDNSGLQATRMDVTINYTSKPLVLILGAYDPTIWNLAWTKNTLIIGVFASGYYKQVIAGLPVLGKNSKPEFSLNQNFH